MKPERTFIADRPLARHCPELLRAGPTPAELTSRLVHAGERLARLLAAKLAPLSGGEVPAVRCGPVQECTAAGLGDMVAPLAANCLLGVGDEKAPLLVSFEAEGVLRLVDRAFGGPGTVASPLPEEFSLSGELMVQRLEALALSALATTLGAEISPKARSGRLPDLPAFAKNAPLVTLPLDVTQQDGSSWTVTLAVPLASLGSLFGEGERLPAPRTRPHNAATEPFGDLPLTLSAVLVDMRMAVAALSELRVGQVLPVSVARSVPLRIGAATIAHGTIGALDDRVAVQITQAF